MRSQEVGLPISISQVWAPKIASLNMTKCILRKAFWHCRVFMLADLPLLVSFLCMSCGSGRNLYLFWRGPAVITSNTYHIFLHPGGFYLWLHALPTLMKSHKPKGNIKSQLLICLLSTAPFPFMWSVFGELLAPEGSFLWGKGQPDYPHHPCGSLQPHWTGRGERTQAAVVYNFWRTETVISLE